MTYPGQYLENIGLVIKVIVVVIGPLSCVSLINTIFIIINRLPDIYNDRLPAIPT